MTKPSECKWCGAEKAETIISPRPDHLLYFGCWTSYDTSVDGWSQDEACVDRVMAQAKILREQVRQALEKLKAGTRWSIAVGDDGVRFSTDRAGRWADASTVEDAIAILKGVSDDETK